MFKQRLKKEENMYTPDYNSALFALYPAEVITDYSMYVSQVLRRKHYGKTRKYRR